jgi:hypothetical protein
MTTTTARLALSRLAASSRKFPTVQRIKRNSTIAKNEGVVVSQVKMEPPPKLEGKRERERTMHVVIYTACLFVALAFVAIQSL